MKNPSHGSLLGTNCATVVNLNVPTDGETSTNEDESWVGQFKSALTLSKGEGEDEPSCFDFFFHFLSIPWKVFFALGPPPQLWGGYPSFAVSLLSIGLLTAVVEQLGHLLGCVAGLKTQVTGVTIIAIGTSLPDTMASRTAALHDNYADASIGNITGSNCVNVFLGLGLPWVIRTMYYWAQGGAVRETGYQISNTASLQVAVLVFDGCGLLCVILLILRRNCFGGELGGPSLSKWLSGGILLTLWLTFATVVTLQAYEVF